MLFFLRNYLFVIFLFCFSSLVFSNDKITTLQNLANSLNLSQAHAWRRLLHLDESGKSYVDDKNYFLSPEGKSQPEQELLASIAELINNPELQCRYPWRSRWLSENLPGFSDVFEKKTSVLPFIILHNPFAT